MSKVDKRYGAMLSVFAVSLAALLLVNSYLSARQVQRNHALIQAVKGANIARVKVLLDQGADANARDIPEHSLWDWMRLFLHQNKNTSHTSSALLIAMDRASAPDIDTQTTQNIARQTALDIARLLIQHGADVNAKDNQGDTPLLLASREDVDGQIPIIKLLLEKGADVHATDKDGCPDLILALQYGNTRAANLLLDYGANVNAPEPRSGMTPLMAVLWMWIRTEDHQTFLKLIGRGANIYTRDRSGMTCLHIAAENADTWYLRYLLDHGMDVNARDNTGSTPLMCAINVSQDTKNIAFISRVHRYNVALLLSKGAKLNFKDKQGYTALDDAFFSGDLSLYQRLKRLSKIAAASNRTKWES